MTSEFKWAMAGDTMVLFNSPGELPDDGLNRFFTELRSAPTTKLLAASVGVVVVNGKQRKKCADELHTKGVTVAVVTDERIVRGIVTAVAWLGLQSARSFAWAELQNAVRFLDGRDNVIATLMDLRDSWETSVARRKRVAR
jgi:hypothetical protein